MPSTNRTGRFQKRAVTAQRKTHHGGRDRSRAKMRRTKVSSLLVCCQPSFPPHITNVCAPLPLQLSVLSSNQNRQELAFGLDSLDVFLFYHLRPLASNGAISIEILQQQDGGHKNSDSCRRCTARLQNLPGKRTPHLTTSTTAIVCQRLMKNPLAFCSIHPDRMGTCHLLIAQVTHQTYCSHLVTWKEETV